MARLLSDVTLEDVEDDVVANIQKANEALSKTETSISSCIATAV
ncbi:MAG: hypothetical protein V3V98_07190 [Thermoplasmata archaeon]